MGLRAADPPRQRVAEADHVVSPPAQAVRQARVRQRADHDRGRHAARAVELLQPIEVGVGDLGAHPQAARLRQGRPDPRIGRLPARDRQRRRGARRAQPREDPDELQAEPRVGPLQPSRQPAIGV